MHLCATTANVFYSIRSHHRRKHGVFAADEFLFDTRLTSEFVVGELTPEICLSSLLGVNAKIPVPRALNGRNCFALFVLLFRHSVSTLHGPPSKSSTIFNAA